MAETDSLPSPDFNFSLDALPRPSLYDVHDPLGRIQPGALPGISGSYLGGIADKLGTSMWRNSDVLHDPIIAREVASMSVAVIEPLSEKASRLRRAGGSAIGATLLDRASRDMDDRVRELDDPILDTIGVFDAEDGPAAVLLLPRFVVTSVRGTARRTIVEYKHLTSRDMGMRPEDRTLAEYLMTRMPEDGFNPFTKQVALMLIAERTPPVRQIHTVLGLEPPARPSRTRHLHSVRSKRQRKYPSTQTPIAA